MGARSRAVDAGGDRARRLIATLGRDLRETRRNRNLSITALGRAAGISPSTVSRIERGALRNGSLLTMARLGLAVGLDLSAKYYPGGEPIRDAAQVKLLASFRARLHPSLRMLVEVPIDLPGDQRALDAKVIGSGWTAGVEAETGPTDGQATSRRLSLKQRDAGVDRMILLLADTAQSRRFVAAAGDLLDVNFPVPSRLALARLSRGEDPRGNAIIVMPRRDRRSSPRP